MPMSKMHYVAIAKVLSNERQYSDDCNDLGAMDAIDIIALKLCQVFIKDNPSFSEDKFLAAVGTKSEQEGIEAT